MSITSLFQRYKSKRTDPMTKLNNSLFFKLSLLFICLLISPKIKNLYANPGQQCFITTVAGLTTEGYSSYGYSGDGGPATSAQLQFPTGIAVNTQGEIFISDTSNGRIRKVT